MDIVQSFNFVCLKNHKGNMIIWSINFFKIGSITFEDLKNHDFWRCVFNKSSSFLCDKKHGCIIYMMYDQGVIKNIEI